MARRTKDAPGRVTAPGTKPARPATGRVTPKGTAPRGAAGRVTATPAASGRYTPPIAPELRQSPWWVPAIMLGFFAVGVLGIVLSYLGVLPSSPSNWYLLGGLGCIIAGFITATRYH